MSTGTGCNELMQTKLLHGLEAKSDTLFRSYTVVVSTLISDNFGTDRIPVDVPVLTLTYIFRLVILTYMTAVLFRTTSLIYNKKTMELHVHPCDRFQYFKLANSTIRIVKNLYKYKQSNQSICRPTKKLPSNPKMKS